MIFASRTALLLSASLVAIAGCERANRASSALETTASASTDPAARNKAFWMWFESHASDVATITTASEPIADQLHAELSKVRNEITFELGLKETPRELIVSADGIKAAFPAVESLVAAAPPLPGWKVIAFRQRRPGLAIQTGGVNLTPKDVKFISSSPSAGKVAVKIFVPGRTPANATDVDRAVLLLLDAAIGEYDVETRIGGIDITSVGDSAARDARALTELPAVVDAMKK